MTRVFQLVCIMTTLSLVVVMAPDAAVQSLPWDEAFFRLLQALTVTVHEWINVSMSVASILFPIAMMIMLLWQQRHRW